MPRAGCGGVKLHEHEGRALLARFGVPVPEGFVAASAEEVRALAPGLRFPLMVKAQVLAGGRGKAGGIATAASPEEAEAHAARILGMRIQGLAVRKVLLVPRIEIAQELYLAALLDRSRRATLLMASARGGVDIESVPDPEIAKAWVNPLSGYSPYHGRELLAPLGLAPGVRERVEALLPRLYEAHRAMDCELVEINPLAVTPGGEVLAADAKVLLDDAALFRHPEFAQPDEELTPLEQEARAARIAFVELGGDIGVIANGAGLTMATLDALAEEGGRAGVFLDLGGTDDAEQVKRAFRLLKRARPRVCLLNLFGGITKTDTVALGLQAVLGEEGVGFPIVARIKGTNEERAREILRGAGLRTAATLEEAARLAVQAARGAA